MAQASTGFYERLRTPLLWWPVAVVVFPLIMELVVVLGPQLSRQAGWTAAIITYLVSAALGAALVLWASGGTVVVRDGELRTGGGRLPLSAVRAVRVADRDVTRRLLGVDADTTAFLSTRGWIHTSVVVEIDDPADDTPYWLVSTRRGEELAATLLAGRPARQSDRPPSAP